MARETLALQRDIQRHLRADGAWTDPALGPGNESRKLSKTRGLNGICCSPAQVPWLGASSLDSGFQLDPVRKAQWRASVPASRALVQAHGRSKIRTSATSCSIHTQSLHAARETLALQRDIQRHLPADGRGTDPALGSGNESRKFRSGTGRELRGESFDGLGSVKPGPVQDLERLLYEGPVFG